MEIVESIYTPCNFPFPQMISYRVSSLIRHFPFWASTHFAKDPDKFKRCFGNPDVMNDDDITEFWFGRFSKILSELSWEMSLGQAACTIAVLAHKE